MSTALLVFGVGLYAQAQLVVRNAVNAPYTPEALIRDVFLGDGVEIVSVKFDGKPSALGYFEDGDGPVGIKKGLVLTTGVAQSSPNSASKGADATSEENAQDDNASTVRDYNLEQIVPYQLPSNPNPNILNVARYTITFVPKGDRVSFRYAFASEEYPEFVCSEYNDVFGFFISGPGFAGPYENGGVNIALVPGTNLPVRINSINGGTEGNAGDPANCSGSLGSLSNAAFYRDNTAPGVYPVYDGLTRVLTAEASVVPCQTYTIQITIGDVGDPSYDSGVFLEAESFSASLIDVNLETPALGNELAEGCAPAVVTFGFNTASTVDRWVSFTTGGTAQSGLDYSPLPDSVRVPAGQRFASFPVQALTDNLTEGTETLTFEVQTDPCTTRSLTLKLVDRTIVPVPMLRDTTVCPGAPVAFDAKLSLGVDSAKTFRNSVRLTTIFPEERNYRDINVAGVVPDILNRGALARVCVTYDHPRPEDLDLFLFTPAGKAIELSTDNGGATFGSGVVCFTVNADRKVNDPTNPLPLNGDYLPEGDWRDILSSGDPINGTWRLQVTDDTNGQIGNIQSWSITFNPKYALTYKWSPAAGLSCTTCPNPVASPTASTTYTVDVRDSYGCLETRSVRVEVRAPSVAPVVSCTAGFDNVVFDWPADANAKRFEVSVDGGAFVDVGTVSTYKVDGLALNQTVSIVVRAVGECQSATGSGACTTRNCPAIALGGTATDASCGGYADGTLTLVASGGVAPYRYVIGGDTLGTGQFSGLRAGTYDALVLDANGCIGRATFSIGQPPAMTMAVLQTPPTICGAPVIATATASGGGGAPYAFAWSDGQSGAVASFGVSGTYYVTATDAGGCRAIDSAVVTYPTPLRRSLDVRPVSCAGAADGGLTVSASGGVGPYLYDIAGGLQPSATFDNLSGGIAYTVRVVDALGCTLDTTVTLAEPLPLTISFAVRDLACFGDDSGSVRAAVAHARGAVAFAWTGQTSTLDSIGGLAAGSYTLTVRDSAGCTATATTTVRQPGLLSATATPDSVRCSGTSTGGLRVRTLGGTAPFSFSLNGAPAQNDSLFGGLPTGSYRVEVVDAHGCRTEARAFVEEPAPLSAFHQLSVITCAGERNGGVDLTVSGGTRPYAYAWSDGATTEDRTGLGEGRYDVVVTDAKGCEFTYGVTLDAPLPIRLRASQTNVTCFGKRDGAIALNVIGGRPDYDYAWTGPGGYEFFGPKPTQLAAGDYALRLRDSYGCGVDTVFSVTQPIAITLTTIVRDTICFGASNAEASVTVAGGTAPFAFAWNTGEVGPTAVRLAAGLAKVRVTDANGCVFRDSAVVNNLERLNIELSQRAVACYRDSNGRVEVVRLAYGTRAARLAGFSYAWRGYGDSTRSSISGLGGRQEVFVVATDARGCLAEDSITVAEPAPLNLNAVVSQDVSCYLGQDGRAVVEVGGGNAPYTYAWRGSSVSSAANPTLGAGRQSVRVVDAKGCTDSTSVMLRQPDSLRIGFEAVQVNCFADNSGSVTAAGTGGNVPYAYAWRHGPTSRRLDSVRAGVYVLSLVDAKGCRTLDSVAVVRDVAVEITTEVVHATCAGETDGSIEVVASGGRGPYQYRLRGEAFNRFGDFRFLAPGAYVVEAKDRDGCPSPAAEVTVEEPQALIVEAGGSYEIELGDSLELSARVFNALGEVTFEWLPRDSGLFVCPTCPTTFVRPRYQGNVRVIATDRRGCTGQDVLQLMIKKSLTILVPTGFTPDGDGRDDVLVVHGKSGTRIKSFQVFNRWGELVHEAGGSVVNATAGGWDGSYRQRRAPAGTYIWKVEAEFLDGSTEVITGQTTLIR